MYGLPAKSPSIVARYKTFAKAIEAFKRYVKTFICLWQNTYFHLSFQNVVCLQVLLTQFPDDSVSWHYPGLRASGSGLTRSHMEKVKMVRTRSAKECMNTMYQQSSVCSTNCKCPFYNVHTLYGSKSYHLWCIIYFMWFQFKKGRSYDQLILS